jgi:hypothetical protein
MQHLEAEDLYDEVEAVISASGFIEKTDWRSCCSSRSPAPPPVARRARWRQVPGSGPTEQPTEHATTLARSLGMTGAPVARRNAGPDLGDV